MIVTFRKTKMEKKYERYAAPIVMQPLMYERRKN